tara:strand:- start:3887 stop:4489 length:603 start_codon:yes stop_codon:yes gene_type:complete
MNKLQSLVLAITLLVGSVSVATAQDFEKGREAFIAGDYAAALQEWKPMAEQGNANAQFMLGFMYRDGQGVPQDDAEAVKWYQLAAELGVAGAQRNLGDMYRLGQGVPQDYAKAKKWYQLAAEQGVADAQANLGVMYSFGEGVPRDYVMAYMWYDIASANGHEKAGEFRDKRAGRMTQVDIAKALAMARICMSSNYQNCGY